MLEFLRFSCSVSLLMLYCYFKFAANLYSTCLLKCLKVTLFVDTVFWVRTILWLPPYLTFLQHYKWHGNMWLNWSFQRPPIIEMSEHQQQFIKFVFQSIPTYFMSLFTLLVSLCDEIERMMKFFWWGHLGGQRRGINWFSWINCQCTRIMEVWVSKIYLPLI